MSRSKPAQCHGHLTLVLSVQPNHLDFAALQNREAVLNLASFQLKAWFIDYRKAFDLSTSPNTKYPLPSNGAAPRVTRFLGAMFSRVGYAGAVRPANQFLVLKDIFNIIHHKLSPELRKRNMRLPMAIMKQAALSAESTAKAVKAGEGLPELPAGVIAALPDYHTLALIGQRECIPVPYAQEQYMRSIKKAVLEAWQAECNVAILSGQPIPSLPEERLLLKMQENRDRKAAMIKSKKIRDQVAIVLDLITQHA